MTVETTIEMTIETTVENKTSEQIDNAKVLVIDDEQQILWLVSRFLRKLDYEVEEASGGEVALEMLKTDSFAVVLSDLKMPVVDGLDILEYVKVHCPDTVFILMTAFATIDLTISALRKGVYDFLTKPLELKELALTVQQALQHRELTLQNRQLMASLRENNLILERLHRDEQRKSEQLRQINAISRQITAILDVDRLVDTVIEKASKAFHFESMSFGVIDQEEITFKGSLLDGYRETVEQSVFWKLTQEGEQAFVRTLSDSPSRQVPYDLVFPLQAGDQLVGFWVANWHPEATDREENLPYLESLAAQTAIVLENAHLYALAKRADELAFVNQVGEASKQSLNLKETIQSVLICVQSFGAALVEVCLFDEQHQIEQAFSLIENHFYREKEAILGAEFVTRIEASPLILREQQEISHICPSRTEILPIHSLLGVPLYFGTQYVGTLTMGSTTPYAYSIEDGRLLQVAGRQVAMAIENARLFQQIQEKQQTIEESRNTLRAIFDGILDGIYIVDRNSEILAINRTQTDRSGHTFGELVGQNAELAFPQSQRALECIQDTFAGGNPVACSERHMADDGGIVEWNICTYPVSNEGGNLEQVVVVVRDITEQRQLEASLIQSEKMASVGQLAAGIAHEINNPMTVISANVQILSEEIPESDPLYESVELIYRATERAAGIVQNLLRLSRPEQFEFAPIDLNLSIEDTISLVKQQLAKVYIDVTTELTPNLPSIWGNLNLLRIVWLNLILNAQDAICDASRRGEIQIQSSRQDHVLVVRFSDNGIGMPPDVLKRVYDPFFTTKGPNKGTGLGLFNCYRAIEQHHGEIRVESEEGTGTTFEIRLPIQPEK
jgi:PAS domain S-box-containing protein